MDLSGHYELSSLLLPKPHIPFTLTQIHTTKTYTLRRCKHNHSSSYEPIPITRGLPHKQHCPYERDDVIWTRLVQWIIRRLHFALNSSSYRHRNWPKETYFDMKRNCAMNAHLRRCLHHSTAPLSHLVIFAISQFCVHHMLETWSTSSLARNRSDIFRTLY